MKYVYLVFMYQSKYHYAGHIYEGHYLFRPKVFAKYDDALKFKQEYKDFCSIRRTKLY